MKYFVIAISITLCFSLILGISVSSFVGYMNGAIGVLGNIVSEVVSLSGFPQASAGYSMPLKNAELGVIADKTVGIVDIRSYIERNFVPSWASQEGDYGLNIFEVNVNVYPQYYYGNVVTEGTGLTYRKQNIYTGRMIRLDYEIKQGLTIGVASPNIYNVYKWQVYIFPATNSLRYLVFYEFEDFAILSDGYNSLVQFLEYDGYDIYYPILNGNRGKLNGNKFIIPEKGGRSYKIEGLLYTNVNLDNESGIFLNFMKG